jgi:hypothetical protein
MFGHHRKHTYRPPLPVTVLALLCYMEIMLAPHRKHRPPRPVTGIALFCHMQMMFVPHRKQTCELLRPVTGIALLFMCKWWSYLTGNTCLHGLLRGYLCFLVFRWCSYFTGSTGLHCLLRDTFTFLYVDDVRTSQETHIRAFTGITLLLPIWLNCSEYFLMHKPAVIWTMEGRWNSQVCTEHTQQQYSWRNLEMTLVIREKETSWLLYIQVITF